MPFPSFQLQETKNSSGLMLGGSSTSFFAATSTMALEGRWRLLNTSPSEVQSKSVDWQVLKSTSVCKDTSLVIHTSSIHHPTHQKNAKKTRKTKISLNTRSRQLEPRGRSARWSLLPLSYWRSKMYAAASIGLWWIDIMDCVCYLSLPISSTHLMFLSWYFQTIEQRENPCHFVCGL